MTRRTAGGDPSAALDGAFPIVGVGASAGGLEAFTQLLNRLPARTGMAYVLVQHLDPTHTSMLRESLARATKMPVVEAEDAMPVEADHVYVIPPNVEMGIASGRLKLTRPSAGARPHLPIDAFFRALSLDRGRHAIGVVLSGTASDGTEGLRAIKAENGFTLAQEPTSAKYSSMPQSAIAAGVVDAALTLPEIAAELVRLGQHPYVVAFEEEPTGDAAVLAKICAIVRRAEGVDFSEYKRPTFERRLARRMALRQVTTYADYLRLLERDSEEITLLYEDALIHVTSFFRDPEAFEALKKEVFPAIMNAKEPGAAIRIWVAGCSTGEEIYSIAIALLEFLRERGDDSDQRQHIQLFGSDASQLAIERARAGVYVESALRDVGDDRRRKYFVKIDGGYRIHKSVRDLCVFVHHDLARDPPFSKLDLVSCRNVLIYFDQPLQKRIVAMLHYCLSQPGFLLLGQSESIGSFANLFSPVDKAHKIFTRTPAPSTLHFAARTEHHPARRVAIGGRGPTREAPRPADAARHLDRLLLSRYVPPSVLVNDKFEVLQFRGDTGDYLRHAPGAPSSNLTDMARSGLMPSLRQALLKAKKSAAPVRVSGVQIESGASRKTCDVVVMPFAGVPDATEPLFVVMFEAPQAAKSERRRRRPRSSARLLARPTASRDSSTSSSRRKNTCKRSSRSTTARTTSSAPPTKSSCLATRSSRAPTRSSRPRRRSSSRPTRS